MPVKGSEELKRTNEIRIAIPLLDAIDIEGKTITADALLTQKEIAAYLVEQRNASYHFTVKGNQAGLFEDIKLYFQDRQEPDFIACDPPDHGRAQRLSELSPCRTSISRATRVHGEENR